MLRQHADDLFYGKPAPLRIGAVSTTEQKGAMWRSKSGPLWLGDELVPVVHGRAPRAARRAFPMGRRGGARGRDLWAHGVKRMALKRPGFSFWFCSA